MLALMVLSAVSCTDTTEQTLTPRKVEESKKVYQLVAENPELFVHSVPIFSCYEDMEKVLEIIEQSNSNNVRLMCNDYGIQNPDMDKYLGYCTLMENCLSKDYDDLLESLESESDDAYRYSSIFLDHAMNYSNVVSISSVNGAYTVEPTVELDIRLLRNEDDILVCEDSIYYFTPNDFYVIPIEDYIKHNKYYKSQLAQEPYSANTSDEDSDKKTRRKISNTVIDTCGKNTYKLSAAFHTHYYHNIFKEWIEMHNYVTVKNYKKVGACFFLKKLNTKGEAVFNLAWKTEEMPSYFKGRWDLKIFTNEKHAIWKYRYEEKTSECIQNNIIVYPYLNLVTSSEYFINDLRMDIDNGYNHMNFFYSYY